VSHLSPADFDAVIRQAGTVVIDVRTPAEYAMGHLAATINIDVRSAEFRARAGEPDRKQMYAVYCQTGHRSAAAAAVMVAGGFSDVVDLAGGLAAWLQSGRSVMMATP
jgi:phage shock protein E